jgi:hypothetical protein
MAANVLRRLTTLIFACLAIVASLGIAGAAVTTTYINLGGGGNARLWTPSPLGASPRDHIGIVAMHPTASSLDSILCTEMANRGYRTLCADHPFVNNGDAYKGYEDHSAIIARAINCLKGIAPPGQASSPCTSIAGITKVIIFGYSQGGPLMTFYQNIAENGAAACQKPERLIPCDPTNLSNLPKPDGLVLGDSHMGDAVTSLTYTDPAVVSETQPAARNPRLDMFDPRNGYDTNTNGAQYSDRFSKAFLAGQSRRHNKLIDEALHELRNIESGRGNLYADDMPFVVPGSVGARLWQADTRLLKCTKRDYLLLTNTNPGGEGPKKICSVRLPAGRAADALSFTSVTSSSVRAWLGAHSVLTTKDYNQTPDDITGIVWESSNTSTATNIEGVTKPLLIVVMGAHYFMRPDEIILEHAINTSDKTMVANEGATHGITPCTACAVALGLPSNAYGDTVKRFFDFVDGWLSEPGRF